MDEEMAQCNDGDDGEKWPACPLLRRIDRQVNGNGQPGIVQQIGEIHDWVVGRDAAEETRDKLLAEQTKLVSEHLAITDRRRSHRETLLTIIIAFIGLILAFLTYIETTRQVKAGELHLPHVAVQGPAFAHSHQPAPQDAQIQRIEP